MADAKPEVKVNVGVVIEVNKKVIPLIPKDSAFRVTEVGLQPGMKVDFGKAQDCLNEIVQVFNKDWTWEKEKDKLTGLPDSLQKALTTLLEADLSIEQLHLKLIGKIAASEKIPAPTPEDPNATKPADKARDEELQFTLGMSLTWPDVAKRFALGGVSLAGIYLNVTNEGTTLKTI